MVCHLYMSKESSYEDFFKEIKNEIAEALEIEEICYANISDKTNFKVYPNQFIVDFIKGGKHIILKIDMDISRVEDEELPECEECPEEKYDDKDKKIADLESRIKDLQAIVKFLSF